MNYHTPALRFDGVSGVDTVIQQVLVNQAERASKSDGERCKIIMNIAVRLKFGNCPGAKKKVAGGFGEISVAQ